MSNAKKLLVSIHDVTPVHAQRLLTIMPIVEAVIGEGKAALLAVPHYHGEATIGSNRAFAARLRGWSDAGNEVFLHGYFHRDQSKHSGISARFKARHLTSAEGEFLGLSLQNALILLTEGRKRVEDVIGRSVAGFIAPAWLYSDGAKQAIAELGFALAEDHFKVWQPETQKIVACGPVITYASRSPARLLSSLLWSRIAGAMLKPTQTVRIGVHPHDCDAHELVTEIGRSLTHFARSHRPARYADLLD
jgi:uncharacterized protein